MDKVNVKTSGITSKHIQELIEYIARFIIKKPYKLFCIECGIPTSWPTYEHLIKCCLYYNVNVGFHIEYTGKVNQDIFFSHDSDLSFEDNEIKRNYDKFKERRRELKKRDKPASDGYIEL